MLDRRFLFTKIQNQIFISKSFTDSYMCWKWAFSQFEEFRNSSTNNFSFIHIPDPNLTSFFITKIWTQFRFTRGIPFTESTGKFGKSHIYVVDMDSTDNNQVVMWRNIRIIGIVGGCQCFRDTCCLHLQRLSKSACSSETSGSTYEALRYKPERRGFDSRWCHWNFSLT
jgi:hypothetical protein